MSFVGKCFLAKISKTGHYTNVVCYEVKILYSEQTPAQLQRQILSGVNAVPPSFFHSCFFFPRFVGLPVELGLGTLNSGIVHETWGYGWGRHEERFACGAAINTRLVMCVL